MGVGKGRILQEVGIPAMTRPALAIFVCDQNFLVTDFNAEAETLTGRGKGELSGKLIGDLLPSPEKERVLSCLEVAQHGNQPDGFGSGLHLFPDGSGKQVEVLPLSVLHRKGAPRYVVIVQDAAADLSELQQLVIYAAELGKLYRETREQVSRLSAIHDIAIHLQQVAQVEDFLRYIHGKAASQVVTLCLFSLSENRAWVSTRRAAPGSSAFEVRELPIVPSALGALQAICEQATQKRVLGKPAKVFLRQIDPLFGRVFTCLAFPFGRGGACEGLLLVGYGRGYRLPQTELDFTNVVSPQVAVFLHAALLRRLKEEKLLQLQELERLRDDFIAQVEHEFQTPITSMKVALGLLEDPSLVRRQSESYRALLSSMRRSLEKLSRLIAELGSAPLRASQLWSMQPQALEPRKAVGPVLELVGPLMRLKGQHLRLEVGDEQSQPFIDPLCLQDILTILLENAHKFSPPGSSITLRGYTKGASFLFEVEDEGPGVPPEEQENIFLPFYRREPLGEHSVAGRGLGLALARALAEQQGGQIGVRNGAGKGAIFWLSLPCAAKG